MILDQIADHLIASGIEGASPSVWVIKKGFQTPTPDQQITIYETVGGLPDIVRASSEASYDELGFQVRVRGAKDDYPGARDKIQEIFEALHQNEPIAGTGEQEIVYLYAKNSGPLPLGKNSNGQFEFTWNFVALVNRDPI